MAGTMTPSMIGLVSALFIVGILGGGLYVYFSHSASFVAIGLYSWSVLTGILLIVIWYQGKMC